MKCTVIGAGLAGCEATWQLIKQGIQVDLYEMRPDKSTAAHKTNNFAELVCSNSFRGADLSNAVGLLKEELKIFDSLVMEAALSAQVPAGGALAVDRDVFSKYVDDKIRNSSLVNVITAEVEDIPDTTNPVIIATGPLTGKKLAHKIEELSGNKNFAFFDAISPIFFAESLDFSKMFRQSRYDKGTADYWNIPFTKEQYYEFVNDVKNAEKYAGNQAVESDSLELLKPFEGCMPVEDIVERGDDTLRFGPFKPKGLTDPKTGLSPYGCMQLRQDDKDEKTWSLVGMQTRMKRHEQDRIFRKMSGMENAEFIRYGSVHRNSFINSPKCLLPTLQYKDNSNLFFAGQITGVEGYVESTAGGLVAGTNVARLLKNKELLTFPIETAIGALMNYISSPREDFQPMNISFGLMPTYLNMEDRKMGKKEKRIIAANKALEICRSLDLF